MDYSFGNWVKRRRKSLDLTQQELARRVGCSPSAIFKIESDERRPSRQIADLLAQHLGIPADQRDLFFRVARQEKSSDKLEDVPPVSKPQSDPLSPSHQFNLPVALTSLIGREHELRAIIQQTEDPGCRLLTLTGPGGVGKTRIALEVAHHLRETFEYGACFVSLVGTSSSEYIIPAIADALGFVFSGSAELKVQLFNYLKGKQILLVLDNLEHLLNGIELLDDLLENAPHVKVLTTSREQLNLRAEWVFEVQGLPVPTKLQSMHPESNSAAALFLQRAKQVNANFSLVPEETDAVARICQLVDGLPLGIELAASWVRMMSVKDIALEIERSVDFLTANVRDIPQRHRSMRAVFDYSWNLLPREEQSVMMQLSVFRGGFTRHAAEHVANATLLNLSALTQKSLLRHDAGRYDFHELIRQYAAVKLRENSEDYARANDHHASYYASWLRLQESRLEGPQLQEALNEISQEIDNLRSAWEWMLTHSQISNLRDSLTSLFVLHDIRNWIRQGASLFDQAIKVLQSREKHTVDHAERLMALGELMVCQGHMRWHLGETQEARVLLHEGLDLLGSHRDCPMLAEVLLYLSILEYSQGNYPDSRRLAEECVSMNREQGRAAGIGYALSNLGVVCMIQGEYENAYTYLREGLQVMQSIGHSRGAAITLTRLGAVALRLGRLPEAQQLLEESLEITRRFNDRWGIGNALNYLGLLALAKGDLNSAESLLRQCAALFREDSDQLLHASSLAELGYILNERGADSEAWQVFQEALQTALASHALPVALYALAGLATLYAREGAIEKALQLAMYTRQHPASNHQTKKRAEKLYVELGSQLTPSQIEAVRSRVQSASLDAVVSSLAG